MNLFNNNPTSPTGEEAGGIFTSGDQGERFEGGGGEAESRPRGRGRYCAAGVADSLLPPLFSFVFSFFFFLNR